LKDHITIAVDLLEAAKSGNGTALEEIEKKWYANADNLAILVGGIMKSNLSPIPPNPLITRVLIQ
jgi:hypothetical protein